MLTLDSIPKSTNNVEPRRLVQVVVTPGYVERLWLKRSAHAAISVDGTIPDSAVLVDTRMSPRGSIVFTFSDDSFPTCPDGGVPVEVDPVLTMSLCSCADCQPCVEYHKEMRRTPIGR